MFYVGFSDVSNILNGKPEAFWLVSHTKMISCFKFKRRRTQLQPEPQSPSGTASEARVQKARFQIALRFRGLRDFFFYCGSVSLESVIKASHRER